MEHPPSDTVPPSPLCGIDACPGVALPQAQPPGQVDLGEQAPPLTTLLTNHYEAQIGAEWPPSAEPPHYRPDFLRASMPEDAEGPQCSPPSNGGCRGGSTHSCGGPVFSHDDYKDKYPEDTIGGECGHSARVWRMFYDEARVYDVQMAGNHRENLDVVIVVSGFFSVVVALFLTQASQKLDVNYGQMTSLMVFEMVQLQRAALTGASDSSIPVSPINPDTPFIPSTSIIWVNNLWFTSLALSLATAFLAVLAKHWIHHYMSLTSGTARDMARLRQSRFIAFMKWHVSLIINLLPAALNISFTIFSVGLVVFALNKECSAGYAVAAICVVAFLAYVAAIVMPTIDPQTPYATPLSEAFYALYHSCVGSLLDLGTKWNIIKFIDSKQKKQYSTALQALELERVQKRQLNLILRLYIGYTLNQPKTLFMKSLLKPLVVCHLRSTQAS
ncbi:hypothetical protein BDZ89DRAFT_706565 [Hymenopellis radicata]|nr:hypothetical protein BDZ89DRAFT_706565 [Hymenopellis radicata]